MGLGVVKAYVNSFILKKQYKAQNRFTFSSRLAGNVNLEGGNFLDKSSLLSDSSLGFASYIGHDTVLERTIVGRYTCIGPNVSVITGAHPSSKFVSVHPAFFSLKKQVGFTYVKEQIFNEEKYVDNEETTYVKIGNDVWIGNGARIMAGVTIGDGAIIGAGALVTKNVEPYTIVGGVPARVIKRRFDEQEIEFLMELRWWDRGEKWIKEHAKYFDDIKVLMKILND